LSKFETFRWKIDTVQSATPQTSYDVYTFTLSKPESIEADYKTTCEDRKNKTLLIHKLIRVTKIEKYQQVTNERRLFGITRYYSLYVI